MEISSNLEDLLAEIWGGLQYGALEAKAAFHTAALGTLNERGECSVRTVVLRRVEPEARQIICHTDIRSEKVGELGRNPAVSWLFYSPGQKIQVRTEGKATVHHLDAIAQEAWEHTTLSSRRAYLALSAPGTQTDGPDSGLPETLAERSPLQEESEAGWPNFGVIACTIERLDWLYLDAKGHTRAQFEWSGTGFVGRWVIP